MGTLASASGTALAASTSQIGAERRPSSQSRMLKAGGRSNSRSKIGLDAGAQGQAAPQKLKLRLR